MEVEMLVGYGTTRSVGSGVAGRGDQLPRFVVARSRFTVLR